MSNLTMGGLTREEWLRLCASLLAYDRFAPAGFEVPNVNVSVGFPYRARGDGNGAIGQCWHGKVCDNKLATVFVSPILDDTARVAGVLAHELVHATIGVGLGHGSEFKACALAVGLNGKMTATGESEEFKQWVAARIIPSIGPYPHPALRMRLNGIDPTPGEPGESDPKLGPTGAPRQSTRLLKATCSSCGYVIRVAKRWADMGLPRCGCPDHKRFQLAA